MGYVFTALLIGAIATLIVTAYETMPNSLKRKIGAIIDDIVGETR